MLHGIPITIIEIVRVLEKVYKYPKTAVREPAEAIINPPQHKVELAGVFLDALKDYNALQV